MDSKFDETSVLQVLAKHKVRDVISMSTQKTPVSEADENVFSLSAYLSYGSNYLQERHEYFFDKNREYKLYYVPKQFSLSAERATKALLAEGVDASLDTGTAFPWFAPLVCLVSFVLHVYLCRRRVVFAVAAIFPLLLSWAMPFYNVAVSVALLLPYYFCVVELLDRKDGFNFLVQSPLVILPFVSFFACVMTSLMATVLWVLCVVSSAFFIVLVFFFYGISKNQLVATGITPVNVAFKSWKKFRTIFLVSMAALLVLFACFFVSSRLVSSAKALELPSKNASSDKTLPGLNDYLGWHWKTKTFPYRLLDSVSYERPRDGESVVFPRYSENGTIINYKDDALFVFDNDYRQKAVKDISDIRFPAIEKLMRSESIYGKAGYAAGKQEVDMSKTSVLLGMAFCACGLMFLAYMEAIKNIFEKLRKD